MPPRPANTACHSWPASRRIASGCHPNWHGLRRAAAGGILAEGFMKLLLDTHAFIWWGLSAQKLHQSIWLGTGQPFLFCHGRLFALDAGLLRSETRRRSPSTTSRSALCTRPRRPSSGKRGALAMRSPYTTMPSGICNRHGRGRSSVEPGLFRCSHKHAVTNGTSCRLTRATPRCAS